MDFQGVTAELLTVIGSYGTQFSRSSLSFVAMAAFFWKGDNILSNEGRKSIWHAVESKSNDYSAAMQIYCAYLGPDLPLKKLSKNIFLMSVLSIIILLIGFSFVVPEFLKLIIQEREARGLIVRGILTEGLLTVFVVNYIAVQIVNAFILRVPATNPLYSAIAILDLTIRVIIFGTVIMVVYCTSAVVFGSFTGDPVLALRSVGPALRDAIGFQNITGVYLYSSAISGLPVFLTSIVALSQRSLLVSTLMRIFFKYLPFHQLPVRTTGVILGVFLSIVSFIAFLFFRAI